MNEETTFYQELQTLETLDLRDKRGRRHDLSFILVSLIIAFLRKRDGNMSSLHRSIVNLHEEICNTLEIEVHRVVSRAQLPRILSKVNRSVFERLVFGRYGIKLTIDEQRWFAGDGKELRGSIEKGDTRGEAIVQLVAHENRSVLGQSFYNGTKESEKPCLRNLIEDTACNSQKITADALHLNPATTESINGEGGIFLIGLKENQSELLAEMKFNIASNSPLAKDKTIDKGHGRLEIRNYEAYEVSGAYIDKRWDKSDFQTVFKVDRVREDLKTNNLSTETSYYMSNGKPEDYAEYFQAIRTHWSVEVSNHYRDVTLQEDKLCTKIKPITRITAGCRTLVLELLNLLNPRNRVALLESFQDNFDALTRSLKTLKFL